jgi:hypothetical protein
MQRREALRLLAGTVAVPVLAGLPVEPLFELGRSLHRRTAGRKLQVLDPHQDETVATIAELIIPKTETPGARAARVNEFVDLILAEWYDDDERERFLAGLADADARSQDAFGKPFVEGTDGEQVALLKVLDDEAVELQALSPDAPDPFFRQMKWLTLYGYYTSELGITRELRTPIIPPRYDGCAPLQVDGR